MPTLHTKRGTKIEEVIAVRYYTGGKHQAASLLCITERGRQEEIMVQDLVGNVEGAIKEMEKE